LDTQHFHILLTGDFNIPNFNWALGLSMNNCHYYPKQKEDAIYASTCVLGLLSEIRLRLVELDLFFFNSDNKDIKNAK
jgi:hypothetical protein